MRIHTVNKLLFITLSALTMGVAYSDTAPIVVPSFQPNSTISADTLANLQSQIAVLKAQAEVAKLKQDIDKTGGGLTGSLGLPPMPDVNQSQSYSGWKLPNKPGSIPEAAKEVMGKKGQNGSDSEGVSDSNGQGSSATHHYASGGLVVLSVESFADNYSASVIVSGHRTTIKSGDKLKIGNLNYVVKAVTPEGVLMSFGKGKPLLYTVESY